MDKKSDGAPPDDPAMFAAYVASLSGELARLSRENGLTTLAYLLEMARLEARNVALNEQETDEDPKASISN
ncbi:MAG: hypothetical protein AB7E29_08070 [Xanthobacter sp.]